MKDRPISKSQKALLHLARSRVGLKEEEYRALLSGFGVKSSSDLTQAQFTEVMRHLEKLGFVYRHRPVARGAPEVRRQTEEKRALLIAVGRLLESRGRPWAYADGMAKRMFQVDRAVWLTAGQLHKLLQALKVEERRRQAREEAPADILAEMARDLGVEDL